MTEVLIIAGSKSDSRIVDKVSSTLDELSISYSIDYASAHREPERVKSIVLTSDAEVIIAIAGLAAALPGYVASLTERVVIGVPVSAALGGLDALLSIAQMPKGVPVAAVGIDNGQNAAHLAARILGKAGKISKTPSTYAEAGVDEGAVSRGLAVLGKYVKESFALGQVTHDYGQYANMVRIEEGLYLALATDGVGSKVLIAELMETYHTIGIDCVAMNVNDLICVGAMPVGFVDYLASETPLSESILEQIGESLLEGCRQSEIPILGGETAILPEMIRGSKGPGLDLAGTAVGIAREGEAIDGSSIAPGDVLIGIASNGIHSNGFTLARKVLLPTYGLDHTLSSGKSLGEELLRPTRIYVPHFKALRRAGITIKGLAHITGSGFRKILRLGKHQFRIDRLLQIPEVFELIRTSGSIEPHEMFTTFNMGIGLVVVVSPEDAREALEVLSQLDEVQQIGTVESQGTAKVEISQHGVVIE